LLSFYTRFSAYSIFQWSWRDNLIYLWKSEFNVNFLLSFRWYTQFYFLRWGVFLILNYIIIEINFLIWTFASLFNLYLTITHFYVLMLWFLFASQIKELIPFSIFFFLFFLLPQLFLFFIIIFFLFLCICCDGWLRMERRIHIWDIIIDTLSIPHCFELFSKSVGIEIFFHSLLIIFFSS
jgi:hypothetical protein